MYFQFDSSKSSILVEALTFYLSRFGPIVHIHGVNKLYEYWTEFSWKDLEKL